MSAEKIYFLTTSAAAFMRNTPKSLTIIKYENYIRWLISFMHNLSAFLGILGNLRVPAKNPSAGS
jgi:hypothetical protein